MKSNTILAVVVGALVVLGGGYYFFVAGNNNSDSMKQADSAMQGNYSDTAAQGGTVRSSTNGTVIGGGQTSAQPGKFNGTITDLIKRGGELKCTINTANDATVSSGEVFVSGKNTRGNFTSTIKGFGDISSYMISDGITMFWWSNATSSGYKMPVSKSTSVTNPSQGSVDFTKSYNYMCEKWSVDKSMFIPPSNIQFVAK